MKPTLSECPSQGTPYLYTDSSEKRSRYIIKARCKMWNCPYCGIVNAHQHKIRILNGINELQHQGQCFDFVTLTSHERLRTTEQCLFVWRKAWRKLQERARRVQSKSDEYPLAFVYTTEFHKDKRLHWHMLINSVVRLRWWKDNSRECGLGYQVSATNIENGFQATNYITKYLSKSLAQADYPKKMRRINYSQSFPAQPTYSTNDTWSVLDAKTSIVECIEDAWKLDLSTYLKGIEIVEILS